MTTLTVPALPISAFGIDLRALMAECLARSTEQVCSTSDKFYPYLFCYIDGEQGDAVCKHKSYLKALSALLHEVARLPDTTNCYVISYYGTKDYRNAVFVEGFVGNSKMGYVICQKLRTTFFTDKKVPYKEPFYLGKKQIMTQSTFSDRLIHSLKILFHQD